MIGTLLNVLGILTGGIAGLIQKAPLSTARQSLFRNLLGVLILFYGLRLTWLSLNGTPSRNLKLLGVTLLAMMLGKPLGRLLRLQSLSNRLGHAARARMDGARPDNPNRMLDGFFTCSVLFCASPLGILGAICDGLPPTGTQGGFFYPLGIKAVMDGLAVMGFVRLFGWGAMLSAAPVLVFQGTITLACSRFLHPHLQTMNLLDPVDAVCGILIFSMVVIVFELRRFEAANYLPSLVIAPLLWRWIG